MEEAYPIWQQMQPATLKMLCCTFLIVRSSKWWLQHLLNQEWIFQMILLKALLTRYVWVHVFLYRVYVEFMLSCLLSKSSFLILLDIWGSRYKTWWENWQGGMAEPCLEASIFVEKYDSPISPVSTLDELPFSWQFEFTSLGSYGYIWSSTS